MSKQPVLESTPKRQQASTQGGTGPLSGTLLFAIAARWLGWLLALAIVIERFARNGDHSAEPALLLFTLVQTVAVTLYFLVFRPQNRALRFVGGSLDDVFLVGLLDLFLALAVVFLSGADQSPYYLFGVSALLIPAAQLPLWQMLFLAVAFVAGHELAVWLDDGGQSVYEEGQETTFAGFVAFPFVVGILVNFLAANGRKLAAGEREARRLLAENVRLQEQRRELAVENERTRLAREVHDGIAQSLFAVSINLEAVAESTERGSKLRARLDNLTLLARETLLEVRSYIFDLRPLFAGQDGVGAALRKQAQTFSKASGLPVSVEVVGDHQSLAADQGAALYRITQEALSNVFRHSQASRADVRLSFEERSVTLEVSDDGTGLETGGAGRGLQHIRERVKALAGRTEVEATPGRGTMLRVILPRDGHEQDTATSG